MKNKDKEEIDKDIKNKSSNKIIETINLVIYYFQKFNYKIREINKLRCYLLNNK